MPRPNRWSEILTAAGEEFRDHGYDNATLESIGARVGILKGSIYNYVASKEELLLAVVEQPAKQLLAELERLQLDTGSSVAVRLRELIRMQVRIFSDCYPAAFVYLQHIGRMPSPRFAEFREMDARYMAAVEALVAEGARNGEFSLAVEPPGGQAHGSGIARVIPRIPPPLTSPPRASANSSSASSRSASSPRGVNQCCIQSSIPTRARATVLGSAARENSPLRAPSATSA